MYETYDYQYRIVRLTTALGKVRYKIECCHGLDIWWYRDECKTLKRAERKLKKYLKDNIVKTEVVYTVNHENT
jgi:predicted secreted protein